VTTAAGIALVLGLESGQGRAEALSGNFEAGLRTMAAAHALEQSAPPGHRPRTDGALAGRPSAGPGAPAPVASGSTGPDRPPLGRSLFDTLLERLASRSGGGSEHLSRPPVPYPFERLLAGLDAELPRDENGRSTLKAVLIPLGRALERHAAAPDFFASPRVVVAVDSEPERVESGQPLLLLKDRLFLGYQARAERIEVISWNERAGRFEFQVVEGYAPGRAPRVRYARRALCMSCHHNGGPIFAEAPWDETNANPRIAERLLAVRRFHHGVAADGSQAGAVDDATDRGNRFAALQHLWREGCAARQRVQALRCRAGAFAAMVERRLSAYRSFDASARLYRNHFVPLARRNWRARWPDGLAVASADIANRDPTRSLEPMRIPPELEPFRPRPPEVVWTAERGLERLVAALGAALPRADLVRIDARLHARVLARGERRAYHGPCTLASGGALASGRLLDVRCAFRDGSGNEAFHLVADIVANDEAWVADTINSLALSDGTRFTELAHTGGSIRPVGATREVRLGVRHRGSGFHVWLGDGRTIETMAIHWPRGAQTARWRGEGTLSVVSAGTPLRSAIETLLERAQQSGTDVFDDGPLRAAALMQALAASLGLEPTPWCCDD